MGKDRIIATTVLTLALIIISTTTATALSCGDCDICVNESGWWRDGGAFIASTAPIQAAINTATAGETICVKAGSYTENVDIMTPHLTLRGEGAGVVTVTAASSSDHVFDVTADHVNISGFTATGATDYLYAGIHLSGADNCNISENDASNNYCGIYLNISSNNTLANNTANSNGGDGIWLYDSSNNNALTNNNASLNNYGICLGYSSDNTLTGNTMSGNAYNFYVGSYSLSEYTQNIDTSNTVDGKPIYYWVDQKDKQIPSDAGFVGVVNGTNITVRDLTLTNNRYGVLFVHIENSRIENVTALNNDYGIQLGFSSNNTLTSNTASNNWDGIRLDASRYNTLANNTLANNSDGIVLVSSIMDSSSDNLLYNNYFNNTNNNAYSDSSNQWNITKTAGTNIIGGSYLGGNYWSDYAGVDNTGDGLGDTLLPYNSEIPYGGDFHPLTAAATPPTVTVLRPDGQEKIPSDSVYDITWSVTAGTYDLAADPINISYSNDSGATWSSIASNEPDDGRYSWSVPNINSSNCTVNVTVRDVNGNTGSDASDSTFTILPTDSSTNETIPEGETTTVEGPTESNTTVNVTTSGDVTVTVAYYNETPHPDADEPDGMVPKYIDIAFSNNDNVTWPIYVEMHYTDDEVAGMNESSFGLYYYNENGEWLRCSDTGVNVDDNYVWANVTEDECPGSPFGAGGYTDTTPPVIIITTPVPYELYMVGMELDFSATDESGVATVVGNLTNTSGGSQFVDTGSEPEVGVYTLVVTATDTAGNTNISDPVFFVVYDADGGHATGEGWFDPDVGGKADFKFTVRYKNDVSTGKLNFQYKDADIKLRSTSIDWLVISSMSAQYQGTGTINKEGLYTFRVQAKDNGKPGADVDHFDIKIWEGTDTEADPYYEAKNTIADRDIKVHTK